MTFLPLKMHKSMGFFRPCRQVLNSPENDLVNESCFLDMGSDDYHV